VEFPFLALLALPFGSLADSRASRRCRFESVPAGKQIHMIVDNYATHKHPKVDRWLSRHPRFHMHFTPTGCSWLNMVEHFFRDLTESGLRRGVFRTVEELIEAIGEYIDRHSDHPKPLIWTAKATDILEKVKRARAALHNRLICMAHYTSMMCHPKEKRSTSSSWEAQPFFSDECFHGLTIEAQVCNQLFQPAVLVFQ
jgi:transposase